MAGTSISVETIIANGTDGDGNNTVSETTLAIGILGVWRCIGIPHGLFNLSIQSVRNIGTRFSA